MYLVSIKFIFILFFIQLFLSETKFVMKIKLIISNVDKIKIRYFLFVKNING